MTAALREQLGRFIQYSRDFNWIGGTSTSFLVAFFTTAVKKMKLGRGKPVMRRHLYVMRVQTKTSFVRVVRSYFFESKLMRDHQPPGVSRA